MAQDPRDISGWGGGLPSARSIRPTRLCAANTDGVRHSQHVSGLTERAALHGDPPEGLPGSRFQRFFTAWWTCSA